MWDLIVSVPDHCLSFYFLFLRLLIIHVQIQQINYLKVKNHYCIILL